MLCDHRSFYDHRLLCNHLTTVFNLIVKGSMTSFNRLSNSCIASLVSLRSLLHPCMSRQFLCVNMKLTEENSFLDAVDLVLVLWYFNSCFLISTLQNRTTLRWDRSKLMIYLLCCLAISVMHSGFALTCFIMLNKSIRWSSSSGILLT